MMVQPTTSDSPRTLGRGRARSLVAALTVSLLAVGGSLIGATSAPASALSIVGTVTAADTGNPIFNVFVGLLDSATSSTVDFTSTDHDGHYQFASEPAGTYIMSFTPQNTDAYVDAYYPSSQYISGASPFVVNSATIDVSTALPKAGSVSGHLTFSHGYCGGNIALLGYDAVSAVWRYAKVEAPDGDGDWTSLNVTPGSYRVQFYGCGGTPSYPQEYYNDKKFVSDSELITVTAGAQTAHIDATLNEDGPSNVARLAGQDRFATSARIAQAYPTADVVFVANGLGYPDALSAAPAAAFLQAPLLLTQKDSLPSVVRTQIERLHPTKIYVVGGTGVVSTPVFDELSGLAVSGAVRLFGSDRYATSRDVFSKIWHGHSASTVFLADGRNYPDALSSTAAAAAINGPVVLVNGGSSSLPAGFGALLQSFGTNYVVLAGGTSVLSDGIETAVNALAGVTAERFFGGDRYATSYAINNHFFGVTDPVFLATGSGFADALAGAALAGKGYSPLYLVPGNCVPQKVLDNIYEPSTSRVVLFGGTGVLSAAVEKLISCTPTS